MRVRIPMAMSIGLCVAALAACSTKNPVESSEDSSVDGYVAPTGDASHDSAMSTSDSGGKDATGGGSDAAQDTGTVTKDSGGGDTGGGGNDAATDGGGVDADTTIPKHIVIIMMENNEEATILENLDGSTPYLDSLISTYGSATHYYGVTHPSNPNYLASISGQTFGKFDDESPGYQWSALTTGEDPGDFGDAAPSAEILFSAGELEFTPNIGDGTGVDAAIYLTTSELDTAFTTGDWYSAPTIVDQIETAGMTWRAYMESMPSVGFTEDGPAVPVDWVPVDGGETAKIYRVKHNPFMYFSQIAGNVDGGANPRLQNVVPFAQFASDVAGDAAAFPNYVWISPNMCNDMHGVGSASVSDDAAVPNACLGGSYSGPNDSQIPLAPLLHLGDVFIQNTVTAIQASPIWNDKTAIVIVWDEDNYYLNDGTWGSPTAGDGGGIQGGGSVVATVITSYSSNSVQFTPNANHYTLLATIQNLWGLPCLANSCGVADAGLLMTPLFQP